MKKDKMILVGTKVESANEAKVKSSVKSNINPNTSLAVAILSGFKCIYCKADRFDIFCGDTSMEHLISKHKGLFDKYDITNIRLACNRICNANMEDEVKPFFNEIESIQAETRFEFTQAELIDAMTRALIADFDNTMKVILDKNTNNFMREALPQMLSVYYRKDIQEKVMEANAEILSGRAKLNSAAKSV